MHRSISSLFFVVLSAFPGETAFAHGGSYPPPHQKRPGVTPWTTPSGGAGGARPNAPTTPGPRGASPGPAAPTTPTSPPLQPPLAYTPERIADELPDFTRWQLWWSFNHDPFLDLRARLAAMNASSGPDRSEAARRALRGKALPCLLELVETGGGTVLLRQALVAVARIGSDPAVAGSIDLEFQARHFLSTDRPEIHEASILALGVLGDPGAAPLLRHLLLDDDGGRAAMGDLPVGLRCRAFAAYALGLIGGRSTEEPQRRLIVHALLDALGRETSVDLEIQVACVLALGLVPVRACRDAEQAMDPAMQVEGFHLCGGVVSEYLAAILAREDLDPWLRAHAAAALGRLARSAGEGLPRTDGPTKDDFHPAILSRAGIQGLLVETTGRGKVPDPLRHGAAIGLGLSADADGDPGDVAARQALLQLAKKGDALSRRLALIGLGESLARPASADVDPDDVEEIQDFLQRELVRGRGGRRPWAALALAVAGFGELSRGASVSRDLVFALRHTLGQEKDEEEAAALTLSLAVLRDEDPATHEVLQRRYKRTDNAFLLTQIATALGWLRAREAGETLREELGDGTGPLARVLRAATALRLLGSEEVAPVLAKRLASSEALPEQHALLATIARLDLLEVGDALVDLLDDEKKPDEERASAAWALGVLCDATPIDWSARYANDLTYPYLTWTLSSPLGDSYGLLDWR